MPEPIGDAIHPGAAAFQRRNRLFAVLTTTVLAGLALVIAVLLYALAIREPADRMEIATRLAITWSPALFYLWALWSLRSMFAALASGGTFKGAAVAGPLARVGWALALGSALTVLVSPVVLEMVERPHAMSAFAAIDVPAVTLGVVGLALVALSGMLRRASELEREASDLKTVLGDFI